MKTKNFFALICVLALTILLAGCGDYMSQSRTLKSVTVNTDPSVTKLEYTVGETLDLGRTSVRIEYSLKGDIAGQVWNNYDLITNPDNLIIEVKPKTFTQFGDNVKVTLTVKGQGGIAGTKEAVFYVKVTTV